ncbi:ABC transporter permease [Alkalicoccobacillus porphyridii]|uniref:ABC transporter permease n=1 Tax=Alkalicoccobacillus porphyridii TaxID=2597270 RepID=A0A553ZU47_9BACI|nr:ABC transporter permease [Alkalicoccobacillus porphyridii]TSB44982.1 ABC transporter permease [Alkalicoccobacillus porphyridii]
MNNFWTVTLHTLSNRLKSKAFIITTIITVIFIAGIMNVDRVFDAFSSDEDEQIIILGENAEWNEAALSEIATDIVANGQASVEPATEEAASELYEQGNNNYILLLNEDAAGQLSAVLYGDEASSSTAMEIEMALQRVKEAFVTRDLGLEEEELAQIYSPISFETQTVEAGASPERTEEETFQAQAMVYIMVFVIYLSVIIYGTMIATEVATEKSSRVMEILVSSVHPIVQMFGKIFGIGALAILQVGSMFLGAWIGFLIRGSSIEDSFLQVILGPSVQFDLIAYGLIFLALGFLLYGSIAAMLGSLVSRVEDVNTLIQPLIYLLMIAFFIAMFGLTNPESMLVTVTSWIPFFSPIIMFLRFGMLAIPVWEVILSFGVMLASIGVFSVFAAKVYKGGVIMYGSGSLVKGIKSALSLSKK